MNTIRAWASSTMASRARAVSWSSIPASPTPHTTTTPSSIALGNTEPDRAVTSTSAAINPWFAACVGEADLTTDLRADIGIRQTSSGPDIAPRPEDYFDICGTHWINGIWISAPNPNNPDGAVPPAPAGLTLVGCVLADGTYGIFPGDNTTCAALGLPLAANPNPSTGVTEPPPPTTN